MENKNTRQGFTQTADFLSLRERMGEAQVRGKETHKGHPEFISGSTPFVTIPNKEEMPKQVRHDNRHAFTLIELLVVVLIIGILAAVAIPQYQKAVDKSRTVQLQTLVETVAKASEMYYLQHGEWPTNLSELDIEIPFPIINTTNPAQCLVSWVGRSVAQGDDFELALYDGGVGQHHRIAAYFTTGKYKCTGFAYLLDDKFQPALNHKFLCMEAYYDRDCGTNCDKGIFCQNMMGKNLLRYHKTAYLYE